MPKTMTWAWIKNFIGSEPSLDTKVLCLPQIQGHMDRLKRIYSYAISPRIMQLGLEPINLTIPFYLIKILIGHTL